MAALPCCAEEDVEAGSAALRVDWPVYPRRAEHNTVADGGNGPRLRDCQQAMRARTLHRDPQDHVAVALAPSAHGPETGDHGMVQPDQALAALISFW
jgi:hypothetical protein